MSDETLYVNADWSAIVPAGSAEARYGVARKDAVRLGLLPVEPVKEMPKPADKAIRKPRNK